MFMNAEAMQTARSRKPPVTALALVPTNNVGSQIAPDFIRSTFGAGTDKPVWIQSLGNDRDGSEQPKHIATRDTAQIERFVQKWDRKGRGMYFCVSTIDGGTRSKDNAAEMIGLHADIDFKDTDESEISILRKVKALRYPPSRIHATGHGYHCFWLFKGSIRPTDDMERVECALKLLCDLVGGDQSVTHAAALMRLPGSHNTKHGHHVEVTVLLDTPARYELDDLEEWLCETSPVILRKNRPAEVVDNNPFLAHAKANGFKPSIDVEKRLNSMSYMAGGDAAIHATQLAVSASLLTGGMIADDVVKLILDATKGAAAGYGERWNWKREEKAIRKMCSDWLRKHPVASTTARDFQKVGESDGDQPRDASVTGQVVTLAPLRARNTASGGTPLHTILGDTVLWAMRDASADMLITSGEVWRYRDGLWAQPADATGWLNGEIEIGARALELPSTIKLINETRQWLLRHPDVLKADVIWDAHGRVPTRSGLLDIATQTLEPARPEHLATWRIECDYDSNATCPWWLVMLNDFFGDRPAELRAATISTLQEILGAALMENKKRALTRALVLEGPSEAGKTRILDVLGGLLSDRPIATPLDVLGATHGLMEFRRRAPWVLHEAFNAGQWHMSSVVKSILTGDPVQINVKNGAITTQRIRAPVFWGTNHPPQFKEATKAIVNRMIVIKCRVVFDPKNLIGAAKEASSRGFAEPSDMILDNEMPGLLNWAVEGFRRASVRGYIAITTEMVATMDAVRADSNIVAGFLDECAEFDPSGMLSVADFCAAFAVWWIQNRGEDRRLPSNDSIGRAMSALGDNRIATDSGDMRDNSRRYFGGMNLNSIGLDYWDAAHSEGLAKGKTARTSTGRSEVNRVVPESWKERPAVMRIVKAGRDTSISRSDTPAEGIAGLGDTTPKF
jgi:phage/plasmid-associated DNA primase